MSSSLDRSGDAGAIGGGDAGGGVEGGCSRSHILGGEGGEGGAGGAGGGDGAGGEGGDGVAILPKETACAAIGS